MKIFLVTPSYESAAYLEQAVRSVTSQAQKGFELDYIIRDANSTDETSALLQKLKLEFPQLNVRIQPDAGQAAALAEEFAASDADVLGWLNADDILMPTALAQVAQAFNESGADVVFGEAYFIDESNRVLGRYPVRNHDPAYLRTICYLSQPSVFFTRRIYEKAGGIDAGLHYCMDYNLWLRFCKTEAVFHRIRSVLSATRLHAGTKTETGGLDFADEVISMERQLYGEAPEQWHLYRRYRAIQQAHPSMPGVACYAMAHGEYLFRAPLTFLQLGGWSLGVAARLSIARLSGRLLKKSS